MEKINERGCDRPTIRHLRKRVVPLVATVWYDLGIHLLQLNELTTIELNTKNNPDMYCTQMFEEWLITDKMASWNKLIRAVKNIGMHHAARVIEHMLIQDEKKSNEHSITQASQQKLKKSHQKDKNLERLLKNAVESGKIVEFLHIKIFLTGSSAAGKTSLRNSLFNVSFEKEHKPTRLQETKHAYVASILESADGDVEWLVLTPEQQISHFKRLLETERPKNKANKESDAQSDTSESIDFEPLKDLEEQLHNSKGLAPRLIIPDPANLITIVDTGGQPEFIHMLPAIVSCPTINFVVIDMTKELSDKVEVYDKDKKQENKVTVEVFCDQEEKIKEEDKVEVVHHKTKEDQVNKTQVSKDEVNVKVHYKVKEEDEVKKESSMEVGIHYKSKKSLYSLDYTYEELIKLLMSITSNSKASERHDDLETYASISKQPGGDESLIGFVGTHRDKVDTEDRDKLTKQLNKLVEEQDCTASLSVLMNGKNYLFQVDNTKSGSDEKDTEVVKIRKELEEVIKKRCINVYPVPITWMILEIRIKSLYESKHFITFDEFSKVANEEVAIKTKEDIESVLRYFNQLGIFLYFVEVHKMKNYVIIDHQWFYSTICSLMGLSFDNFSINDSNSKERFKRGLLLEDDLLNLKLDDEMETKSLVDLLCHMKIIARYEENSKDLCYIPHILPYCSYYQDRYKYLILEPLLVRFSSGFLPRGFFCSLVVHLLQKPPSKHTQWKKINFDQNYRNVITFYVNEKFYLRLQDKVYYLEIQGRSDQYCERRCMSRELGEIRDYLDQACKNLNLDDEKLEYGFMCCDDHVVTVKKLDSTTKFYCKKCQKPYEMGPLHKLWFEELTKDMQPQDSEPNMKWMHKLIIPQICSQWIKVAYFLEYPIEKKNEIEESQRSDPYKCCEKLMEDWLASDRGVAPKTWYKLILVLKEIPDLSNATRFIEHSLLKEKLLFKDGKDETWNHKAVNQSKQYSQTFDQTTQWSTRGEENTQAVNHPNQYPQAFNQSSQHTTKEKRANRIKPENLKYTESEIKNNVTNVLRVSSTNEFALYEGDADEECKNVRLLLMTVNDNEFFAVLYYMANKHKSEDFNAPKSLTVRSGTRFFIGEFANIPTALVQHGQGSTESLFVTYEATGLFGNLKAIVAVGVCGTFGELGDVIVSSSIAGFAHSKYDKDGKILRRDPEAKASRDLTNHLIAQNAWEFNCTKEKSSVQCLSQLCFKPFLSSSTLIAFQPFRDGIREDICREAMGIEMEGIGVIYALEFKSKKNIDFAIVKAGCDYANEDKNKEWQPVAAMAAADLVYFQFDKPGPYEWFTGKRKGPANPVTVRES